MNNKIIPLGIIVFVAMLGLGAFMFMNNNQKQKEVLSDEELSILRSSIISIIEKNYTWDLEIEPDLKEEVVITIEEIDNRTIEITLDEHPNSITSNGYKWNMALCNITGSGLQYMEEDTGGGFNNSFPENVVYGNLIDEGMNETWCEDYGNVGYSLFSSGSKNQFPLKFRILTGNISEFELLAGTGTVSVVATTVSGGTTLQGFIDQMFYDRVANRWHTLWIDGSNDVWISSTTDFITWDTGVEIQPSVTATYDEFSGTTEYRDGKTYLHFVWASSSNDNFQYKRCELNATSPYIFCGAEQTPFDASLHGQEAADDVYSPKIIIDSNNCSVVAFGFEDDSLPTNDESQIAIIKEAGNSTTTCGDGIWNGLADAEVGFPKFGLQTSAGFHGSGMSVGIESYGDLDSYIYWVDNDDASSFDIEGVFFNGTSNTNGTEVVFNANAEFSSVQSPQGSSLLVGETSITFGVDDGTLDLDAIIMVNSKTNTTFQVVDTGLDVNLTNLATSKAFTSVVDTRADGSNDIWVFGVNPSDFEEILYVNSIDGGLTWSNPTSFVSPGGDGQVKSLVSVFENETCEIALRWINDSATPQAKAGNITAKGCDVIQETSHATDSGTGTAVSITHGLTINSGDVIIATINANADAAISDNNGGNAFTEDLEETSIPDTNSYAIYSRVAGASEPLSYNWTLSISQGWSVQLRVFSGVHADIWDVAPTTSTRDFDTTGSLATAPTMTTSNDDSLGMLFVITDSATRTFSSPTNGYGDELEITSGIAQATYTRTWKTAGVTGTSAVTMSASNDWLIHQIALKPAGDDTTPPTFTNINNITINNITELGVNFNATDETGFDSFIINDTTNFAINRSGFFKNNTQLVVKQYFVNVTINDTSNNLASTIIWVNVTAAAIDTCTYVSGNWSVQCSDNCIITTNTNIGNNVLKLIGAGSFTILADIIAERLEKDNGCSLINNANDGNILAIKGD